MKPWQIDQFLSSTEQQKIYDAFRRGAGGEAPTEADFATLLLWAANARRTGPGQRDQLSLSLLSGILQEKVDVVVIRDGKPHFTLNPIGRAYVQKELLVQPEYRDMMRRLDAWKGTHTPLPPMPGEEGK